VTSRPTAAAASRAVPLVAVAVVVTAVLLRGPVVTIAPVAERVGADLGAGAGLVGLLVSIPVLCFAVCAPLAVALVRRAGTSFALSVAVLGIAAGSVLRSVGGIETALAGTVVIGVSLAVANVVVPVVIAREYPPSRRTLMTGIYAAAINVGTMTVTLATAPLADAVGWRWATSGWSALGLVALIAWVGAHGLRGALIPSPTTVAAPVAGVTASSRPPAVVWLLAVAFAGQAFSYYGMTSWLPSILGARGFPAAEAGAISSIFQAAGIVGALLVPLLVRTVGLRWTAGLIGGGWLVLPIGLLLAPGLWAVWCTVGGLAQAGGFAMVFVLLTGLDAGERRTAAWSGLVQGAGYTVAAAAPIAVGSIHEVAGSWEPALLAIVISASVFAVAVSLAAATSARLLRERRRAEIEAALAEDGDGDA
jgi:MFS transporter, CP family, cyanate transporter